MKSKTPIKLHQNERDSYRHNYFSSTQISEEIHKVEPESDNAAIDEDKYDDDMTMAEISLN